MRRFFLQHQIMHILSLKIAGIAVMVEFLMLPELKMQECVPFLLMKSQKNLLNSVKMAEEGDIWQSIIGML